MTDFPNSPTPNQTFTAMGRTWKWNGVAWEAVNQAANPLWDDVLDKPATFTPSTHTHSIANVTGLQTELDGKQASGSYAAATHTHSIANITDLQTALDGKQAAGSYAASNHGHAISEISGLTAELVGKQPAGSYATLVGGLIPSSQLPSYVDDVIEEANFSTLPASGEVGKIYVTLGDGKIYRWSGSAYLEISKSPGTTDDVLEGANNKYFTNVRASAAAPVQSVAGKSGAVTLVKGDVGLGSVDNTADADKPVSTATQTALNGKANTSHPHSAATISADGFMSSGDKTKLDGIRSPQIDIFATPGTLTDGWTKPANAKSVNIQLVGGGGGGGSGRKGAAGSARSGGGGGGGGGVTFYQVDASTLEATVDVVIGAGGLGGTNGLIGGDGGETTFGIFRARGGFGGNAGTATTATGGAGGAGQFTGGAGGTGGGSVAGSNAAGATFVSGGGGGGGTNASNTNVAPTNGGAISSTTLAGAGSGTSPTPHGLITALGQGGGGGAASQVGNAVNGPAGGLYGGGGGGGGAATDGVGNSGAGGVGGNGIVIVTTYF